MVTPLFWKNRQVISYSTGPRPLSGGNLEKFGAPACLASHQKVTISENPHDQGEF